MSRPITFELGSQVGRWTVLGSEGHGRWLCRCECGTEASVMASELKPERSKQCRNCRNLRHGAARVNMQTKEYVTWCAVISRCCTATASKYRNYGGRGITVCQRWRESFEAFIQDMGECPSPKHSIDRINNDGHYEPGNCRWATMKEQARNRSSNVRFTISGHTRTLAEWAEVAGIKYGTLHSRLKRGWTIERALSEIP